MATQTPLETVSGIAIDEEHGIVYFSEFSHFVMAVDRNGTLTRVMGNGATCSASGTVACGDNGPGDGRGYDCTRPIDRSKW